MQQLSQAQIERIVRRLAIGGGRFPQMVAAGIVGLEREEPVMELDQARAVADRDDGGARQPVDQQAIQRRLRTLVERGGRLVEEQPMRLCSKARAIDSRCCSPPDSLSAQ